MKPGIWVKTVALVLMGMAFAFPSAADVDLTKAVIFPSPSEGVVLKAAEMLSEELAERSGVLLPIVTAMPDSGVAILIGTADTVSGVNVPDKPEAYAIEVGGTKVHLVGRDARGAMFAAGRLIRLADSS
ncbi:MAG: hypothetical protein IT364_23095, partial [Candidatus Hydrogenedentes bacterium]|nr:hypothetical protein [Candidatus Hydrogenedentota bacterium]